MIYIIFEGMDGVGKTTQSRLLLDWLTACGIRAHLVVEPTASPIGLDIRKRAVDGPAMASWEALGMFVADRRLRVLSGFFQTFGEQEVLVQDRSFYSTAVYQGNKPGCPGWQDIVAAHESWMPQPDAIVLLDSPPSVCEERIVARGETLTAFERNLPELRGRYLHVLNGRPGLVCVDARRPVDEVQARVREIVSRAVRQKSPGLVLELERGRFMR